MLTESNVEYLAKNIGPRIADFLMRGASFSDMCQAFNGRLKIELSTDDIEQIYIKFIKNEGEALFKSHNSSEEKHRNLAKLLKEQDVIKNAAFDQFMSVTDAADPDRYQPNVGAAYLRISMQASNSKANLMQNAGVIPTKFDELQQSSIVNLTNQEISKLYEGEVLDQKSIRRIRELSDKVKSQDFKDLMAMTGTKDLSQLVAFWREYEAKVEDSVIEIDPEFNAGDDSDADHE